VDVDLEVEMAADAGRVAGLPHRADPLALPDALASMDQSRPPHVSVEVAAVLAFAVDQQVVPVEDRVTVRRLDREDVAVVGNAAVAAGDLGRSGRGERRQKQEAEEERALQWCSMTRSTMLYSFASSALMK
jgi:hypothetical protein